MSGNEERVITLPIVKYSRNKPLKCYSESPNGSLETRDVMQVNCQLCIQELVKIGKIDKESLKYLLLGR